MRTAGAPEPRASRLLILLVAAAGVNYIDRGLLSASAPLIESEWALSPTRLGFLFSAFFWTYSLFQVVAGWMVDRYPIKWVYAGGYLIWSTATAGAGLAQGFTQLLLTRLMLGVGESVAYPAASRILARDFAESRRGLANAWLDAATKVGPGASMLAGGVMVGYFGWRALFLTVGLTSLLWLLPWLYWTGGGRAEEQPRGTPSPTTPQILRNRVAWVTYAGMFALGYGWYFLLSWLPAYLVKERGFSLVAMAKLGSIPFWVMAAASLAGGSMSDALIRGGIAPMRVRRSFAGLGMAVCGAAMFAAGWAADGHSCLAWLTVACLCLGLYSSNVWAITQTLAGPAAAGRWSGIQNAIGNLGGVVSPMLTGWLVARTGSFHLPFLVAAAVLLSGGFCYLVLLRRAAPVEWDLPAPPYVTARQP